MSKLISYPLSWGASGKLCAALFFLSALLPAKAFACPACTVAYTAVPAPVLFAVMALLVASLCIISGNWKKAFLFSALFLLITTIPALLFMGWTHFTHVLAELCWIPVFFIATGIQVIRSEKSKKKTVLTVMLIIMAVGGLSVVTLFGPSNLYTTTNNLGCYDNLVSVYSTTLEIYQSDNDKHYPDSLGRLKPTYLKSLPRCIETSMPERVTRYYERLYGITFGDYGYTAATDCSAYTLYCPGNNHKSIYQAHYPEYDSINGIIKEFNKK